MQSDLPTHGAPVSGNVAGDEQRTITPHGFSKDLRMTGWRIGYMRHPLTLWRKLTEAAPLRSRSNTVPYRTTPLWPSTDGPQDEM